MSGFTTRPTPRGAAYYVSHRDPSAVHRAVRLLPHLPADTTVLTASDVVRRRFAARGVAVTHLPPARVALARQEAATLRQLHGWAARHRPELLLCDAPFEAAEATRGLPGLVRLRRPGHDHEDRLRRQYGGNAPVLSLYADWLESHQTPDWLRRKTYYTGCLSDPDCRPQARSAARAACGFRPGKRYIVLLKSGTHGSFPLARIARAARHLSQYEWVRLGPVEHATIKVPANVHQVGIVPDPNNYLRAADLVVTDGDEATLHRVAACSTPLICLPEVDAHHAQHTYAHALRKRGLALTFDHFPPAYEWPAVVRRAARLSKHRWREFYATDAESRVQTFLQNVAAHCDGRPHRCAS